MSDGYNRSAEHERLAHILYTHAKEGRRQVPLSAFRGVSHSKRQAKRDMKHFMEIGIVDHLENAYVLTDNAEDEILRMFPHFREPVRTKVKKSKK